jgi:hypothetical protein
MAIFILAVDLQPVVKLGQKVITGNCTNNPGLTVGVLYNR